ncbi:unnamed protein product [Rotaria sp. Silwood1]|nr:unnamed protein product [Rotaria sp. Silwood1]
MSNRQTFHPNKLDYDVFNIKINIGPIDLFVHDLFFIKALMSKTANVNEQLEFLYRYDQHSQRLYFLYNRKLQQTLNIPLATLNLKCPSNVDLSINLNILSCVYSTNIYVYSLSRTNSARNITHKSTIDQNGHKYSSSSIPLRHTVGSSSSTTTTNNRPRLSIASTTFLTGSLNIITTEREVCLRFIDIFNIFLTSLILECLTTYIEKCKTFDNHSISILDGLHIQAQTQSNFSTLSIDLSATKISL